MANIKIQALPKNIIEKKKKTHIRNVAKTFDRYKNINFTQKQKDPHKQ